MLAYKDLATNTLTLKIFEPLVSTLGIKESVSPETLATTFLPFLLLPVFLVLNHLIKEIYNATCSDQDGDGDTSGGPKKKPQVASASSVKSSTPENCLGIVGASGSGKTTLFYYLFTGEMRETVSSIQENGTRVQGQGPAQIKMPSSGDPMSASAARSLDCIDIPGHFNFRDRIQEVLESAGAIILVVDSKDKLKLPEAAEILYDILNNISVLDRKTPILIACNK